MDGLQIKIEDRVSQLGSLNDAIRDASKELKRLYNETETLTSEQKSRIAELTELRKELELNVKDLSKIVEEQQQELERHSTKILQITTELKEVESNAKKNLDTIVERISTERKEHKNWMTETKARIAKSKNIAETLAKDWKVKNRNLKIVEYRLRKLWPKDKLFPRLT